MTHLLRHQLVMQVRMFCQLIFDLYAISQLHRYYYMMEPSSRYPIGVPKKPLPDSLMRMVREFVLIVWIINFCIDQIIETDSLPIRRFRC